MPPIAVEADVILNDGQILPVLGGLRVVENARPQPGHISLFSPSTGILFTGEFDRHPGKENGTFGQGQSWDEAKADESAANRQRWVRKSSVGSWHSCQGGRKYSS